MTQKLISKIIHKPASFIAANKFIILLTLVAAWLRLYQLGQIPVPINQDEAGAAYEAWSILQTGMDKWGYRLPVYFVSWGSGQNVLYSYISIPFLSIFGLNTWAFRLPMALFGILSVPIIYAALYKIQGRISALIAAAILTFSPWHIMMSRWGLESNLLPFFTLLSACLFLFATQKAGYRGWQPALLILSFVTLGLACYAYATFWFVLPLYLILLALSHRKYIQDNPRIWLISVCSLLITVTPLLLFVLKNNLFKRDLDFEKYLPFSAPLLAGDRVSLSIQTIPEILLKNISLLAMNGADGMPWNFLPGFAPVLILLLPLFIVSLVYYIRQRNFGNPFLLQILASLPLFLLVDLNQNRANILWIPVIALFAGLCSNFYSQFLRVKPMRIARRRFLEVGIITVFAAVSLNFATNYFAAYNQYSARSFHDGFLEAIKSADNQIKDQKILVPPVGINYVSVAFALEYPPSEFQSEVLTSRENGIFRVKALDKWIFDRKYLKEDLDIVEFAFISRDENYPCKNPQNLIFLEKGWQIGRCFKSNFNYESS